MLRNLLLWSHRNRLSQKTQINSRRQRGARSLRDISLGMECLESRSMLSANPILSIEANQFFGAGYVPILPDDTFVTFRATFTDTLQTGSPTYNWSIDWQNDNSFDLSGTTTDFEILTPFGQAPNASDPIVGRVNIAPVDGDLLAVYTSPGTYTVKLKLNDTVTTAFVDVYPVDENLFIGNGSETEAFEGTNFTLTLPTELSDLTPIQEWRINWGDAISIDDDLDNQASHEYADGIGFFISEPVYNITAVAIISPTEAYYSVGTNIVGLFDVPAITTISTPDANVNEGELFTLNLENDDVAGDPVFKWRIFWEGAVDPLDPTPAEEATSQFVAGTLSSVTHTYATAGVRNVVVVAFSDDDVESESNTLAVTVNEAPADGVFLVDGTLSVIDTNATNDIVTVTQSGTSISVNSNGNTTVFDVSDVDEIEVLLGGGNDVVVIGSNITVPVTIDGGDGNDFLAGGGGPSTLIGGNGNDILWGAAGDDTLLGGDGNDDLFGGGGNDAIVGGTGNDIITGGAGRDLLIGSQNQDALIGGDGEDILIGGYTEHDNDIAALDNIMAIWGSTDDFNTRVAALTESGGLLEAGVAVFDDDALDIILGGAGRDLVFGDTNPAGDGVVDLLVLNLIQDTLVALN
jgi:Ca2+-binding RTX toxin-like protein